MHADINPTKTHLIAQNQYQNRNETPLSTIGAAFPSHSDIKRGRAALRILRILRILIRRIALRCVAAHHACDLRSSSSSHTVSCSSVHCAASASCSAFGTTSRARSSRTSSSRESTVRCSSSDSSCNTCACVDRGNAVQVSGMGLPRARAGEERTDRD